MARQVLFVENDNLVILGGLKNGLSGVWITSATVTCDILNSSGSSVLGSPITLAYTDPDDIDDDLLADIGEDGNYVGTIEEDVDLQPLAHYIASISVDAGADLMADWEIPIIARRRTS